MWFDILILAILVYFTVRGAARGMVWQLAGIVGIVICFLFADGISAVAGPYVQLEPPLNNWIVLFGAYIVFTFIAFILAGRISEFLAKIQLKEFDNHLGAVFGFLKGALLSLILTFLVVTVSEDARAALKTSRSGIAAAKIVETAHPYLPILPAPLLAAIENYIYLLDEKGLPHYTDPQGGGTPGTDTFGNTPIQLGEPINLGTSSPIPGTATQPGTTATPASLHSELQQLLGAATTQALTTAIGQEQDPQAQTQLLQRLVSDLKGATPAERQTIEQYFQLLGRQGSQILLNDLKSKLGVTNGASIGFSSGTIPELIPLEGSGSVPSSTVPPASSDPFATTPPATTSPSTISGSGTIPTGTTVKSQIETLKQKIVSAYTNDPTQRQQFSNQIEQFLGTLPERVYLGVLQDWNADIWSLTDPDPGTNAQSTLEQRILRQLEVAGIPLNQLDPAMQQRLRAAGTSLDSSIR